MAMNAEVRVVPHDPSWRDAFAREAERLRQALAPLPVEVHHIGSTAVPGLPAKPIIDLLGVVDSLAAADGRQAACEAAGYRWRGEYGIAGRRYLVRAEEPHPPVHVHLFPVGHPEIARHLRFGAYLRAHPDAARRYGDLKLRLAQEHRWQGARYQEGKGDLIRELDAQALAYSHAQPHAQTVPIEPGEAQDAEAIAGVLRASRLTCG